MSTAQGLFNQNEFFFRIRAQTEGEHRPFMGHIVFDYHSRCVPSPGRMIRHILCPRATPCMVLIFALAGTGKHVSFQLGCVDVYVCMDAFLQYLHRFDHHHSARVQGIIELLPPNECQRCRVGTLWRNPEEWISVYNIYSYDAQKDEKLANNQQG